MSYSYNAIHLNEKEIPIKNILTGDFQPQSDFEFETINFIRDWLNGVENFILKTSGSTGEPKLVTIRRDQMTQSARATEKALKLKAGYRSLICLDTRFIAGKMMIVRSLVTDMRMEIHEPHSNPFANLDESNQIDFIALVPYQVEEILNSPKARIFNKIRTVIIGGAQLSQSAAEKMKGYCCQAYITYGMTETISHIALSRLSNQSENNVFELLPDIRIQVDARGCLNIETPYLDTEVVTNDLVEIISSKKFRWLGRLDNAINTGGLKVHPEKIEYQIEKIFKSLNVVNNFFIAGLSDGKYGQAVSIFIEGNIDDEIRLELENRLKLQLQRYERPRRVIYLHNFLYTSTHKLDRKRTVEAFENA
jgi:O-succinylbenzoic acid--CoA ligase